MIYTGIVMTLMSLCKTFEGLLMFVVFFVLQNDDVEVRMVALESSLAWLTLAYSPE